LTQTKCAASSLSSGFTGISIPARFAEAATRFKLTQREQQVIVLIAAGDPWKLVAARLGVSTRTVKFHLYNARGKIEAQNTLSAIVKMLA
jgi:DNA-binding CsgD family transcriptional regulator